MSGGDSAEKTARIDMVYRQVGKRIGELRKRRNLTQEQLANAVGLQRTSITNIEMGRQKVLLHTLFELASVLRVCVEDLLPDQPSAVSALERLDPSQKDLLIKAIPELSVGQ